MAEVENTENGLSILSYSTNYQGFQNCW